MLVRPDGTPPLFCATVESALLQAPGQAGCCRCCCIISRLRHVCPQNTVFPWCPLHLIDGFLTFLSPFPCRSVQMNCQSMNFIIVLDDVFETKRKTLKFLWNTRRITLCSDRTLLPSSEHIFCSYDGEQLRHSSPITSTTSVAQVGDAEFTVTFSQPELHYHIRAASTAKRDEWVIALINAATSSQPRLSASEVENVRAPLHLARNTRHHI